MVTTAATITEKKIQVLDLTLQALADESIHYNWFDGLCCNCGILVRAAITLHQNNPERTSTIIEADQLYFYFIRHTGIAGGTWEEKANTAIECQSSGLPIPEVFQILDSFGFTPEEIIELESCNMPLIEANKSQTRAKEVLIEYLRDWRGRLEKESVSSDSQTCSIPQT
jgi:hypothetical protein